MRVKCLAQEHSTMTRPRLEPGPLNPKVQRANHKTIASPTQFWKQKTYTDRVFVEICFLFKITKAFISTCAVFAVSFVSLEAAADVRSFSVCAQSVGVTIVCFDIRTFINIYNIIKKR